MKTRYYRHKEHKEAICEVFGTIARSGRWVWKNGICAEVYTYKEVTDRFYDSFECISESEFNAIWGIKLQQA